MLDTLKEKFFSFEGRLNRKPFILRSILLFIISFPLEIILPYSQFPSAAELGILFIFIIVLVIAEYSLLVRRLHDFSCSGWWVLTTLIPYASLILFLVCSYEKGTDDVNKYGSNPLMFEK